MSRRKKASSRIRADVTRQRYGMGGPLEVYEDQQLRCRRCLVVFEFSTPLA